MAFVSLNYIIFLPFVLLIYYILPTKTRYIWLLVASYFFYMNWNVKYSLLLMLSTLFTYTSGVLLDRVNESSVQEKYKKKKKNCIVVICIILNLGILFFFKYLNFVVNTANKFLLYFNKEGFSFESKLLLPVGISFYTFQAIGYVIDVYRGDIKCERNVIRYALFVSFFPQLVAGPIERSKNLLWQLKYIGKFDYEKFKEGILLILWGYFVKMVIADRAAIFVDTVYSNIAQYSGIYLLIATVLFGIQIYCDFSGYSCIAIGSAKLLGVDIMTNFKYPYLSTSVAEFWRNWHVSLTSWFRDYLYIPLGGNRKGKIHQYINTMAVFLLSGLWHGANWTYVIWGGLNGLYSIIADIVKKPRDIIRRILCINTTLIGSRIFQTIVTFVLIDISWIFFRANSLNMAINVLKSIIYTDNIWVLWTEGIYECGLDDRNFAVLLFSIIILFVVDIMNKKGSNVRFLILKQDYWFRCITVAVSVSIILLFGIWGAEYNAASFIYFQF